MSRLGDHAAMRSVELLEEILAELRTTRGVRPGSEKPAGLTSVAPAAMTIDEAALRLGCSRTRVFGLLRDGTLRRARRLGRQVTVLAQDVEAALACPGGRGSERSRAKAKPRRSPAGGGRPPSRAATAEGEDFGARIRRLL
jgi:excisionase family DNA binding protein